MYAVFNTTLNIPNQISSSYLIVINHYLSTCVTYSTLTKTEIRSCQFHLLEPSFTNTNTGIARWVSVPTLQRFLWSEGSRTSLFESHTLVLSRDVKVPFQARHIVVFDLYRPIKSWGADTEDIGAGCRIPRILPGPNQPKESQWWDRGIFAFKDRWRENNCKPV